MSARSLSAWAFEEAQTRKLSPSVTLIFLAIAKMAKDNPSIHDLMDGTRLSRRSVIDGIAVIERAGLVTIDRQAGGVSTYHLQPQGCANTSAKGGAIQPEGGAKGGANSSRAHAIESSLPSIIDKKESKDGSIPLDWKPNKDHYSVAVSKGVVAARVKDLGEQFRLNCISRDLQLANFDARFMAWILTEANNPKQTYRKSQPQSEYIAV